MKNHRILREHSEQILVIQSACCSPLCTCGHQLLLLLRKLQVQICWDVKNSIHIAWTSLLHEHAVHRTLIWFHLIKWHLLSSILHHTSATIVAHWGQTNRWLRIPTSKRSPVSANFFIHDWLDIMKNHGTV